MKKRPEAEIPQKEVEKVTDAVKATPCARHPTWRSLRDKGAGHRSWQICQPACFVVPVNLDTCWVEDRVEIPIISSASGRSAICAPADRRA